MSSSVQTQQTFNPPELTFIHRAAAEAFNHAQSKQHPTQNPAPSASNRGGMAHDMLANDWSGGLQQDHRAIESQLMQSANIRVQNESRSQVSQDAIEKVASEARRWKEKHDTMATAAKELAYKAAASAKDAEEIQARHRNLHENHTSMQGKYKALKEELASLREAGDAATALQSDWRQSANKWKGRCQELAGKFEQHVSHSDERLKAQSHKHEAERTRIQGELDEAKAALKRNSGKSSREMERMAEELHELKTAKENLMSERKQFKSAKISAEEQNTEHQREIKALHSAHTRKNQMHEELLEAHKKLTEEYAQLQKEFKQHASLAEHNTDESESIFDELMEAQAETNELKSELQENQTRLSKASRENERLAEELLHAHKTASRDKERLTHELELANQTIDELSILKKEIPDVKARLKEGRLAEQEKQRLALELESTKSKLKTGHSALKDEIQRLALELENAKTNLKSGNALLKEENHRLALELESTMLKLKSAHASLTDENHRLALELKTTKNMLKDAAESSAELERFQQEIPTIKDKILQDKMAANNEVARLRAELAESKEKARIDLKAVNDKHKAELKAATDKLSKANAIKLDQEHESKTLQQLVDSTKDRLRAAKQTISEQSQIQHQMHKEQERLKAYSLQHVTNTKACTHMLANTQQVLAACADLIQAKSVNKEDSPLAQALSETTRKVDSFLTSLAAVSTDIP
jgi:chromosome segregation ATPase